MMIGNDFQAKFYITIWIQFDSFYNVQKKEDRSGKFNVYSPHTQRKWGEKEAINLKKRI